jgi:hypothetical protein
VVSVPAGAPLVASDQATFTGSRCRQAEAPLRPEQVPGSVAGLPELASRWGVKEMPGHARMHR